MRSLQKLFVPVALLVLLLFLLGLGWGMIKILEKSAATLLQSTKKVESLVHNYNWSEAEKAFRQTEKEWARTRQYWPLLIHHQEMDRIEECMGKIKSYLHHEDSSNTLAEIYVLTSYIKHIPENKTLNLQNVF
ncbi:MAG: DUF4363 family protein [Clostridia bacterium]|nr:DUF4363 family protein [Clostridia bacterium]